MESRRPHLPPSWPLTRTRYGESCALGGDAALLDLLPHGAIDLTLLSEEEQRELFDAFHLQLRYDRPRHQVTLRVTIYAEAVGAPTEKIRSLDGSESGKAVHSGETAAVANAPATTARSHVVKCPRQCCGSGHTGPVSQDTPD